MDFDEIVLIILTVSPLLMTLFIRVISKSHQSKWAHLESPDMSSDRQKESKDFKEWSVFIRDWISSRNILVASFLYMSLLSSWYLADGFLSEGALNTGVFFLYISLIVVGIFGAVGSFYYVERFYHGDDYPEVHRYYGKYYDENGENISKKSVLLWPRILTYLVDAVLIVVIVCVEIFVRT